MTAISKVSRLAISVLLLASNAQAGSGAQGAAVQEDALLNPLSRYDPSKLDGFLGRPLFSQSRRAPLPPAKEKPPAPQAQPEEPLPDVRLVGVVQTPTDNIAQLFEQSSNRRYSVRIGDFLGDWAVAAIDRSSLTLKKGGQETVIRAFRGEQLKAGKDQPQMEFDEDGASWGKQSKNAPPTNKVWTQEEMEGVFGKRTTPE